MRTHSLRLGITIGLASLMIALAALIVSPIALGRPIDAQRAAFTVSIATDTNVLINPDFENGYSYPLPCCNNIAVPMGWNIRWYTDTAIVIENITYTFKQPEVKIIDNTKWPFDSSAPNIPPRIHSGRYAVDSFVLFAAQDTTLYQQADHIPLGTVVTGSAWLHAWASSCNPFPQNATILVPAISLQGTNDPDNGYQCVDNLWPIDTTHMQVGLDPFGGTDPRAASVVWNWDEDNPAWWGPYDYYSSTLPVTVTAQSYTVTLFLRSVTRQPTRYDDVYFDTASLAYHFPIEWQIDQGRAWPLSTSITIGLQTLLSLTQISVALQDPIGDPAPIDSFSSAATPPYTLSWRFVPAVEGTYRFTVTAHELPDSLVKTIAVQTLPFDYQQDHLLTSIVPSDTTLITYVLASPITLTNLSSQVNDPGGASLTTTLVSSDFNAGWYNFVWQFTVEASGLHTVTLDADEFMSPFMRSVLVATARIYLPIMLRG